MKCFETSKALDQKSTFDVRNTHHASQSLEKLDTINVTLMLIWFFFIILQQVVLVITLFVCWKMLKNAFFCYSFIKSCSYKMLVLIKIAALSFFSFVLGTTIRTFVWNDAFFRVYNKELRRSLPHHAQVRILLPQRP